MEEMIMNSKQSAKQQQKVLLALNAVKYKKLK